ncbi:MAG: hypothetical protein PHG19_04675 [Anaerotignum sp.]|nr:hypothetical protein [Anaerotignum sp.]
MRKQKTDNRFPALIKGGMCRMGVSSAEMAVYLRISSSTFSRRMNQPDDFTLGDIKVFMDKLKVDKAALLDAII